LEAEDVGFSSDEDEDELVLEGGRWERASAASKSGSGQPGDTGTEGVMEGAVGVDVDIYEQRERERLVSQAVCSKARQ
jgi:hypothetical protein